MDKIPLFKVFMSPEVIKPLQTTLMSGFIGQGPKVEEFESLLKERFSINNLITLNNGTAGLQLALRLANIGHGDEVLASPLTCTATNWPILAAGAKIKWVDVDPSTCNISLDDLREKAKPYHKAVIFVHWGGYPVDLDAISFNDSSPAIIEDCAHSFGAQYKKQLIGTHGNYCMFSFQAIKHFTTIDGGMLIVPASQYKRAKLLRWYGIDRDCPGKNDFRCENNVEEWGYKFHMNDINATVGIVQLKYIDWILNQHRSNASFYNTQLSCVDGLRLLKYPQESNPSYWLYTIMVERRDDFRRYMNENGVMVSRVHERNDIHSCVREFKCNLPGVDKAVSEMISIPVGWWVTNEDREKIVQLIKKGW